MGKSNAELACGVVNEGKTKYKKLYVVPSGDTTSSCEMILGSDFFLIVSG